MDHSADDDPKSPRFIHATAVVIREGGVLIRGPSGAGKSSLALLLVEDARRRGLFARHVGDDRLSVRAINGAVVVRPHDAIAGLIECRTLGIVRVRHEAACVAKLVVDVFPEGTPLSRLPGEDESAVIIDGVRLSRLSLCVPLGAISCHLVLEKLSSAGPGW